MKVAIVTCYDQNDYVRARTLRTAFGAAKGVESIVMRNEHTGVPARYIEMMWRILKARFTTRPDVWVITFRGYEMLLYMVLTGIRKPIVFDELINMTESYQEHGKIRPDTFKYRLVHSLYGWLARRSRIILADTEAHATYSAQLNKLPVERYRTIPIATDESVFYPHKVAQKQPFTVFYYSHMLPLHGLDYVLKAAVLLKDWNDIEFYLSGGKSDVELAVAQAQVAGARIRHVSWTPFEQLPTVASEAGLTLGGPFGDTLQASFVITGKTYQFMALGVPVLIGKNQVNGEFIDKQNSLLVPQADPQAIADAIIWAKEHPKELAQIAVAGYELYQQRFSQAHVNQLVASLVADLQQG